MELAEKGAGGGEHANGGRVEGVPRVAEPVVEDDEGAGVQSRERKR